MDALKQIVALLITFFATQGNSEAVDALKSLQQNPEVIEQSEPLPQSTHTGERHTTEDFRRIIIYVLIPQLQQRGINSFTGSQAREFVESYVELTPADRKMHNDLKSRWRSLLSQALQSVTARGHLYKKPGKTRTYFIA